MDNADKDLPARIAIGSIDPKVLPEIADIVARLISRYNDEGRDLYVKSFTEIDNKFQTVYRKFEHRSGLLLTIKACCPTGIKLSYN